MIFFHAIIISSLFFVSAIFSVKSCNDHTSPSKKATGSITKILYSTTGGRSGNYESLEASADSLVYIQARRGNEKMLKEKVSSDFWNPLKNSVNLENFQQIRSNPGHALYDGIDYTITIETGEGKFTIVNGHEDSTNYQKIKPFTGLLDKKLAKLRTKIAW